MHSGPYEPGPHGVPASAVGGLAAEIAETRRVLDEVEVVGDPHREWELTELHRLIRKYPDEARCEIEALEGEGS